MQHLTDLFLHKGNTPQCIVNVLLRFPFMRIMDKTNRQWGHPVAAVPPNCRIHTGNNLLGMLQLLTEHGMLRVTLGVPSGTGQSEKFLVSQWGAPVRTALYSLSSYPILLPYSFSDVISVFHFKVLPHPLLVPCPCCPYSFFPKQFYAMPTSQRT